jgi:hypothetical protein
MTILKNNKGETILIYRKDDRLLIHHTDATEDFIFLEDFLIDMIIDHSELILIYNALKEIKLEEVGLLKRKHATI